MAQLGGEFARFGAVIFMRAGIDCMPRVVAPSRPVRLKHDQRFTDARTSPASASFRHGVVSNSRRSFQEVSQA